MSNGQAFRTQINAHAAKSTGPNSNYPKFRNLDNQNNDFNNHRFNPTRRRNRRGLATIIELNPTPEINEVEGYRRDRVYVAGKKKWVDKFSCLYPNCTRTFQKICNMRDHLRVHTGVKPFQCESCSRRFSQRCNLNKHRLRKHEH